MQQFVNTERYLSDQISSQFEPHPLPALQSLHQFLSTYCWQLAPSTSSHPTTSIQIVGTSVEFILGICVGQEFGNNVGTISSKQKHTMLRLKEFNNPLPPSKKKKEKIAIVFLGRVRGMQS